MKKTATKKPNKIVLFFCYVFAWPYLKYKYKLKIINKINLKKNKPPYIIIANHAAVFDPVIIQGAFYPQAINFVGSYSHFQNKKISWLVKQTGTISKFQYQKDLKAVREMLSVIKRGGVLGLFPSGRLPSCGAGFPLPTTVSKLLKLCSVPVVSVKINGSYLCRPKWAKSSRKGRIEIIIEQLFSKEEIKEKDIAEITKIINEKLMFNDYEWNRTKQQRFKGKKLAEGLETTLYCCPSCDSEFKILCRNDEILCRECGFKLRIKETGYFEDNQYFEHPQQWYEWQRNSINKIIGGKEIILKDKATVIKIIPNKVIESGQGEVMLDHQKITYIGEINKQEIVKEIPIIDLFSLPYKAGENFEIADGEEIYKFLLANGNTAVKWSLMVEELFKKRGA